MGNREKKPHDDPDKGITYRPAIKANRISSIGEANIIPDWKTGRMVHCLSRGEAMLYRRLRFDDGNEDVREQFALPYEETKEIASSLHLPFPYTPDKPMTTDFVVTRKNGVEIAYAYKNHLSSSDCPTRFSERESREGLVSCPEKGFGQAD